jgi:hypothetical protein
LEVRESRADADANLRRRRKYAADSVVARDADSFGDVPADANDEQPEPLLRNPIIARR